MMKLIYILLLMPLFSLGQSYDYNLKTDFGAVGDGVTDDRAAIQSALDAISIGGTLGDPKTLYIPDGTYLMERNADDRVSIQYANYWEIHGESNNAVLKLAPDPVQRWGTMMTIKDCDNWKITNFTFDGNSGATQYGGTDLVAGDAFQGVAACLIERCDNWIVDDMEWRHSWYGQFQFRDVTYGEITNNYAHNVDCQIIVSGRGVGGNEGWFDNILIANNRFIGHQWSEPIALYRGDLTNITIEYNVIENKGYAHGILIGHPDATSNIHSNIDIRYNVLNKVNDGIVVESSTNDDVNIYDNFIYSQNRCIEIYESHNSILSGNLMSNHWGGVNGSDAGEDITYVDQPWGTANGWNAVQTHDTDNLEIKDNRVLWSNWSPPIKQENNTNVTKSGNYESNDNGIYLFRIGPETINLNNGDTYIERGAVAFSNGLEMVDATIGGDTVDTSTNGTYIVTYSYAGATTVTRTVNVTGEGTPTPDPPTFSQRKRVKGSQIKTASGNATIFGQ